MEATAKRTLSYLDRAIGLVALGLFSAGAVGIARGPATFVPVLDRMKEALGALFMRVGLYADRLWLDWDPTHPAASWLISGSVALLGLVSSAAVPPPGSRLRWWLCLFVGIAALALIGSTPHNVYRWPVSVMTRAFYCVPALAFTSLFGASAWVARRGASAGSVSRAQGFGAALVAGVSLVFFVAFGT